MGEAAGALHKVSLRLGYLVDRIVSGDTPNKNIATEEAVNKPTIAEIMQNYPNLIQSEVGVIHEYIERIEQTLY